MNKKLTLSLNQDIIAKAKIYAKSNQTSLSKLIEAYLRMLSDKPNKDTKITPLVKGVSGVIIELADDFEAKEAYSEYLMEKHK